MSSTCLAGLAVLASASSVPECGRSPSAKSRKLDAASSPDTGRPSRSTMTCAPSQAADGISVDVICGGFPCQDISQAGKREGIDGERSGLWSEYARLVRELRPRFVIVENVADLLHRGMGRVLGDLAELRYDAEWARISASFVGLPQSRPRIWIVAYPDCGGCPTDDERVSSRPRYFGWLDHDRLGEAQAAAQACAARAWRVDDGISGWVDRVSGLGNAVVPQIPESIGRAIMNTVSVSSEDRG